MVSLFVLAFTKCDPNNEHVIHLAHCHFKSKDYANFALVCKRGFDLSNCKNFWDEDLCFIAVSAKGENIEKIPHQFKTLCVCLAAMRNNARSFPVPKSLDEIVALRPDAISFSSVPQSLREIVADDPTLFHFLHVTFKTPERCWKVIRENPKDILLVPTHLIARDPTMWDYALKHLFPS